MSAAVPPRAYFIAIIALSAAVSGGIGWAIGSNSGKNDVSARAYARQRTPVINTKLMSARRDFILLAGDSHIDLSNEPDALCGQQTINAGLSGASVEVYTKAAETFVFPHKASAAILTIGTNDLLRKRAPDPDGFEDNTRKLFAVLTAHARSVVVTAIPPMSEQQARFFNADSFREYSRRLANLCSKTPACRYVDPYQDIRQPENFALIQPGYSTDGLHLDSYSQVYKNLRLCPTGGVVASDTQTGQPIPQ